MKKKILLFISLVAIFLTACGHKEDNITISSRDIEFKTLKTQTSRSFQRTEAYGEFIDSSKGKRREYRKLLISSGVTEADEIEVEKIVRENNRLNIYINSHFSGNKNLNIKQAILEVRSKHLEPIEDLTINIIDSNKKPINLKIGVNDAISKITSEFKLLATTTPIVHLIRQGEDLVWDIYYNSIFDKSLNNTPLVSFHGQVDANSGEILDYKTELIAEPLDQGLIVNYLDNRFIIYKKLVENKTENKSQQELWVYDLASREKNLLFTSDFKLTNAQINKDGQLISFVENREEGSELFIIKKDNKNLYKINLEDNVDPNLTSWIDKNHIAIAKRLNEDSLITIYNTELEEIETSFKVPLALGSLSYRNSYYLFTEYNPDLVNNKIYLTKDFKDNILVGEGFISKFLNDNTLVYLNDKDSSHKNQLVFYDIENEKSIRTKEGLITNFQILKDNQISYLQQEDFYKDYLIYHYDFRSDSEKEVIRTISNKGIYSDAYGKFFLNVNSPIENQSNPLIYPIDIK